MSLETGEDRHELILYLTPEGPLGGSCRAYFDRVERELGATTAQTYPPHVSLTGFFRRKPERVPGIVAETVGVVGGDGLVPDGAVEVVGFRNHVDWVGLQIRSPWAAERVTEIVESHSLDPGDDPLRPKDWLHLSLAYGPPAGEALTEHAALATEMIDPTASVSWRFGVWQRRADGSWLNHG